MARLGKGGGKDGALLHTYTPHLRAYQQEYQRNYRAKQKLLKLQASATSTSARSSADAPLFPQQPFFFAPEAQLPALAMPCVAPAAAPSAPGASATLLGQVPVSCTRDASLGGGVSATQYHAAPHSLHTEHTTLVPAESDGSECTDAHDSSVESECHSGPEDDDDETSGPEDSDLSSAISGGHPGVADVAVSRTTLPRSAKRVRVLRVSYAPTTSDDESERDSDESADEEESNSLPEPDAIEEADGEEVMFSSDDEDDCEQSSREVIDLTCDSGAD